MRILYKEDDTLTLQEVSFGTFRDNALESPDGEKMNTVVFQATDDPSSLVVTIVESEQAANDILRQLLTADFIDLTEYESVSAAMDESDDEDDDRGNGVNVSFDDVF